MRLRLASGLVALVVWAVPGSALATDLDWTGREVPGAEVVPDGSPDGAALQIESGAGGTFVALTVIPEPRVGDSYAVVGKVKYENVAGVAYLEMWSVLPDGSRYFTRTLAEAGPLQSISGTSDWRSFQLPFFLNGAPTPTRLELNAVLPGEGTVWIGPLHLQGAAAEDATRVWWSSSSSAWMGAIAGSLLGLAGAAVGLWGGKTRRRRLVEGISWGVIGLGGAGLTVAGVALAVGQPPSVWYGPALIGLIGLWVGLPQRWVVRRRYQEAELRRLRAHDSGGR